MRRIAALALALAVPGTAPADDPARRGFDPDPPRPALGLNGQFTTDGAVLLRDGSWWMGGELDWVHGLLALRSGTDRVGWAVEDRLALHLLGAYTWRGWELGAGLPVALWQSSGIDRLAATGVTGALAAPVAASALGDLRLSGKKGILGGERLGLAAALELRLPTGDGRAFFSDGWGATPALLAGARLGALRLDASLGYAFRRPGQFLQLVVQDGVAAGAAVSLDLPPWGRLREWRAIADVAAQVPRGADLSSDRHRIPASIRLGLRARLWRDLWADLGAGTGLAWFGDAGYGHESFRVFAGLRWRHEAPEPSLRPDRDGDGVPDDMDRCPDIPGPAEFGGCPDSDGDGVPDDMDRCPDQPGPKELEGCPDTDGDGIPDIDDKCPKEPGPAQNDGCPIPEGEPVVEIESTRLSLRDMIHFDTAKDTIKPESGKILDDIAAILNAHGEIGRIRVEGHTDNVGSHPYNVDLSQRRAAAVVRALTARGVARQRLEPVGYAYDRPIATNATAFGRARNRRVEFTILDQGQAPAGPPKGEKPR